MVKINTVRFFIGSLVLGVVMACSETVPLTELSSAKQEISKAKVFLAHKYAPEEYNEAKKSLLNSHSLIQNPNKGSAEAKKMAAYAHAKARDSIERSISFLIPESRTNALPAFQKADMAMGELYSESEFLSLIQFKKETLEMEKRAEDLMRHYPYIDNDEELEETREESFQLYYIVYKRYLEINERSNNIYSVSMTQIDTILEEYNSLEEIFGLIEKFSDEKGKSEVKLIKEKYTLAKEDIRKGQIRSGINILNEIKQNSKRLLVNRVLPLSEENLLTASDQLVRLENESSLFDSKIFTDSSSLENLKNEYNTNYAKAKSDYTKSKEEFIKGDYLTSYRSSQEALIGIQKAFDPVNQVKKMQAQLEILKKTKEIVEKSNQPEPKKTSKIIKKTIIRKTVSGSSKKTNTEFKTYTVKPKDTLHKIAGSDQDWKKIYNFNKNLIDNPDLIYPNQVIKIPFNSKPEADIIIEEIYEEVDSIPETKIDEDTEVLEEDYMERMPQKKVNSRVRYP